MHKNYRLLILTILWIGTKEGKENLFTHQVANTKILLM